MGFIVEETVAYRNYRRAERRKRVFWVGGGIVIGTLLGLVLCHLI